ncbi:MAG: cyclic pyranopterin monophosphate synthase MoaC [Actinomycetia bacterium]|nr:cyclic pyranopterin monophosphate synthase MoaC [Actinomycetes bacterium]
MAGELTHLRGDGSAYMVDVTGKQPTVRTATAVAQVRCAEATLAALRDGATPKGDVAAVARLAGIQAAKRTPELVPLAHVVGVHGCEVDLELTETGVSLRATVRTADRTGVEMEALTAVTVAALTVVDMLKGIDRTLVITDAKTIAKSGGRSGDWVRDQ